MFLQSGRRVLNSSAGNRHLARFPMLYAGPFLPDSTHQGLKKKTLYSSKMDAKRFSEPTDCDRQRRDVRVSCGSSGQRGEREKPPLNDNADHWFILSCAKRHLTLNKATKSSRSHDTEEWDYRALSIHLPCYWKTIISVLLPEQCNRSL